MPKVKDNLQDSDFIKDVYFLYEIISLMKDTDEIKKLLKDLLTPSELKMMKRRWSIACLLTDGYDIRMIAGKLKCGSGTIIRVKKSFESNFGGLKIAIERANKLGRTPKIKDLEKENYFDRFPNQPRYKLMKWMFGTEK